MATLAKPSKAAFDVILGGVPEQAVGNTIVQHLSVKGFCVLWPSFEEVVLTQALEDAAELKYEPVNEAVQEGLLGAEGSATILEMESNLDDEARSEGEGLRQIDHALTKIGYIVEPFVDAIGFTMTHRSGAVLSQAGSVEDFTPPLTEKVAAKWQNQFLRHKVMMIIFLGPKAGVLELLPFAEAEAQPFSVKTAPGMAVLVRTDVMAHRYSALSGTLSMSCFLMTADLRKQAPDRPLYQLTPAAKKIEEWILGRIQEIKETEDPSAASTNVPSSFRSAVNHMFHKGQQVAICSAAVHFPLTYLADAWFCAAVNAVDYCTTIPLTRWNNDDVYDPDPEMWTMGKSYLNHGSFMEGTELFDNKLFMLSPNESRGLDPHQRILMEVGYSALFMMGKARKNLMNAPGGIYVGAGNEEWAFHAGREGFGMTTGAACMWSGRLSFCLGMKGPSIALMTDASSGLSAMYVAVESCQIKGTAVSNDFAVTISPSLQLAHRFLFTYCQQGWLSRGGRCFTFNSSADGYVRGDGCAALATKPATELVDGKLVHREKESSIANVAGAHMNTNGKAASLISPHGPGEQETIAWALRNAQLAPGDIEEVEVHGDGTNLADAVEFGSMWRGHRNESSKEPLLVGAAKTTLANQVEESGLTGMIKAMFGMSFGHQVPNLHLRQCNPHIDPFEQPVDIPCECEDFRFSSAFCGVKTRGFGGSNVYMISWGMVDTARVSFPMPEFQRDQVMFWPGGGGELDASAQPRRRDAYFIMGSWTQWLKAEPMKPDGSGGCTFTVTLGENRWEKFQIWLDREPNRVLHPGMTSAPQGSPVLGPDDDVIYETDVLRSGTAPAWLIDDSASIVGSEGTLPSQPGDQYMVSLRVSGKWRMVEWEKLPPTATSKALTSGEKVPAVPSEAAYFIAASWTGYELEEMEVDISNPGVFSKEVRLMQLSGEFQIVRERDWGQVIYPSEPLCSNAAESPLQGPDDSGAGMTWLLQGKPGNVFRIEFRREVGIVADSMTISWTLTGHNELTIEERKQWLGAGTQPWMRGYL